MSRAFTKEDDSLEACVYPPGTSNYVTPLGLEQPQQEPGEPEAARSAAKANRENAAGRTRRLTLLSGPPSQLQEALTDEELVPAIQAAGKQ